MTLTSTVFLGIAGMASLGMAMERHHEQIWEGTALTKQRGWVLRAAGWLLLALAAVLTVRLQGASMGITLWVMEIGLASACVALLLSYAPRMLPWLAITALLAGWIIH